jgi:sec-independent protein translocase protein TatA
MFGLGGTEMFILLILGVLLFGKKLPEVGRSLGKGLVEFKKGLQGIEDEVTGAARSAEIAPPPPARPPQRIAATAPKFEDPANSQPDV